MSSASSIDALVAAGKYAEAAKAAEADGNHARAAELYERIWEFGKAALCARSAGDLGRALRNAIDAKDEALVDGIAEQLDADDDGRRIALDVFAQRRRFSEAGDLAETLGETERAIDMFTQAHRDLDAARLLESIGKDREAGRLLERMIETSDPGYLLAEAQLRLGLLLARRMKHDAATRYLQDAAKHDATRGRAHKALVVALAALGLRDAARDVLLEARRDDDSLPVDIEEFLREHRDEIIDATQNRDDELIAGRYRLDKLLGAGGSGRVFRARDEVSDRIIALKMFHTASARGNQAYERFVREAKIAGAVRHPNLVEVYDFSAEQGFLVMEYMTGGNLSTRLSEAMAPMAVKRMMRDILSGLELAHQRGVIHRDVKPANIFFDARGTAKLGDFGVAHLLDLGQTQTGGLIGTLAYMSPEQITGAPLTITADMYSLGITLFEALTGRLPFLGPDFVAQHLGDQPPAPTEVADNVAPGWDAVLAKLLAKSPSDRYDSIAELRRDIEAIDLGAGGIPKPLILPRAGSIKRRASSSMSIPAVGDADARDEDAPRYQFETTIGRTEVSSLSRAVDSTLNRSVILERYREGAVDPAIEQRLYALARGGGPFVQRSLAYDQAAGVAVFEAPSGTPIGEAFSSEPCSRRDAARLLKRLARAVAPIHETYNAHGSIGETTVLVDDNAVPTVLVCGLGPVDAEEPKPKDDVKAIIRLVAGALGAEPTADALVDALAPNLSRPERTVLLAMSNPRNGEEMYAFADAVEIALLLQEGR